MRLPHHLVESRFFQFESVDELISALGISISPQDAEEIKYLSNRGLPPVVSREVLATIVGVNSGMIWSMERNARKYYRSFIIPKGTGQRQIYAPRIALKIIQKWVSYHLTKLYEPPAHVFGFVPGRSHLQAASQHCRAQWIFSVDVREFFPTTSYSQVETTLQHLGYGTVASALLAKLCCLNGSLAQGAPTSPPLSNFVFRDVDQDLSEIANLFGARLSRYADDIVYSGLGSFPDELPQAVNQLFEKLPWKLAPEKTQIAKLPQRLKVHGLLVHGDHIRLTKGYRNRIRAFEHLVRYGKIKKSDVSRIRGHIQYANQVSGKVSILGTNDT